MTQLSQTALFGELLTSEQQFMQDIASLGPLSREQERALEALAKQGEAQAYEQLLLQQLPGIYHYAQRYCAAYHWTAFRLEPLDLVSEAYTHLLEKRKQCLATKQPGKYMVAVACLTIRRYCLSHAGSITFPKPAAAEQGAVPFHEVRLHAPLIQESESTLLDVLPCPQERASGEDLHDPALLDVLEQTPLTPKQRTALLCSYGLLSEQEETLHLDWYQSTSPMLVASARRQAVTRLQEALASLDPAASRDISLVALRENAAVSTRHVPITDDQRRRLDQARLILEQLGEPITGRRLQRLSHVGGEQAGSYARQYAQCHPVQPSRLARLEQAYHELAQDGRYVAVEELAHRAHTTLDASIAYLRQRYSEPRWCAHCGVEIPRGRMRRPNQKYCSKKCANHARDRRPRQKQKGEQRNATA